MKARNIDKEMKHSKPNALSINHKNERKTADHDSRGNRFTDNIVSVKTDEDILDSMEKEVQMVS